MNAQKAGISLGLTFGIVHIAWSLLVAIGWAQPLMNFGMQIHMVQASTRVLSFSFVTAIQLVIVASFVGFVLGYLFATVWNHVHKR